jgi:hypothetical protein
LAGRSIEGQVCEVFIYETKLGRRLAGGYYYSMKTLKYSTNDKVAVGFADNNMKGGRFARLNRFGGLFNISTGIVSGGIKKNTRYNLLR